VLVGGAMRAMLHATLCQLTGADTRSQYQKVTFDIAPGFRGAQRSRHFAALIRAALLCGAVAAASQSAAAGELSAFGGPAPQFSLPTTGGGEVTLVAGNSRAVLVHYFATWCEPCRDELPALNRLAQRAGPSIKILAISVEEPDARVQRFLQSLPVTFPVLLDRDRAAAKAWHVTTLPTTFILDGNLRPRLFAETDIAWDKIDPAALIGSIAAGEATHQQSPARQN